MNLYIVKQYDNPSKEAYKKIIVAAISEEEAIDTTLYLDNWCLSEKNVEATWIASTKLFNNKVIVCKSKEL